MDFYAMGQRIKKKRIELKLTQEKLAELTGLTSTYIGAIERATSKCSLETVVVIAKALELNIDYLLLGATPYNANTVFANILEEIPEKDRKLYVNICRVIAEQLFNKES